MTLVVGFIGTTGKISARLPNDDIFLCDQNPSTKMDSRSLTQLGEIIEEIPQFLPAGRPLANKTAVYGKDNRFFETLPFMGKVNNLCSGFLISECHVLTARHCSLEVKTNEMDNVTSQFQYRPDGSDKSYSAEVIQIPKFSGRSFTSDGKHHYYNNDFMIAKLSGSPGKDGNFMGLYKMSVGMIGLKLPNICKNGKIRVSGYSGDKSLQKISTDPTGFIVEHRNGQIFMRNDSFKGSSGGPVYCIDKSDKPYVIGINSMGLTTNQGGPVQLKDSESEELSTSVSSSVFFDWVKGFKEKYPCN